MSYPVSSLSWREVSNGIAPEGQSHAGELALRSRQRGEVPVLAEREEVLELDELELSSLDRATDVETMSSQFWVEHLGSPTGNIDVEINLVERVRRSGRGSCNQTCNTRPERA